MKKHLPGEVVEPVFNDYANVNILLTAQQFCFFLFYLPTLR